MPIDRAIIPAAGLGTRLRPLTLAIPKEMLPLGRKPVLEHVVDELRAVGVHQIAFVVSPRKEMIRDYFGDGIRWDAAFDYIVQPEMRGLGDAILRCEEWSGGKPSLVAFGDCVIEPRGGVSTKRLIEACQANDAEAAVLTQRIPLERAARYGVMKPRPGWNTEAPFPLEAIVEKPAPEDAPSDLAVAGRWVLGPRVFELLREAEPKTEGELDLTESIQTGLKQRMNVWAVPFRPGEARRDIGGWDTYLEAAAVYATRDDEFGAGVRRSLGL